MIKKILIIEDNESYAGILRHKLANEGFSVVLARDGEAGVFSASQEQADLIMIDLLLPKMNGIQAMDEIRRIEILRKTPILILTNLNPNKELLAAIEKNSPSDYLIKPDVTLDEIVTKIKQAETGN